MRNTNFSNTGIKTLVNKSANAYRKHFRDSSFDYHVVVRNETQEAQMNIRKNIEEKMAKRVIQGSRLRHHENINNYNVVSLRSRTARDMVKETNKDKRDSIWIKLKQIFR